MADAFTDAFQTGEATAQRAVESGQRQAFEEKKYREAELDRASERRRSTAAAEGLEMENRQRREELERYGESEIAFQKFEKAEKAIDWSSPDAPQQYLLIKQAYIPSIHKHPSTAKKFDALDTAINQNQVLTAKKITEGQLVVGMGEAARVAPWLNLNPPKTPDGQIDAKAFGDTLKAERDRQVRERLDYSDRLRRERFEHEEGMRRETVQGNAAARARTPKLSEIDKAQLDEDRRLLEYVHRKLVDTDKEKRPDEYRRLLNEEARARRRIQALAKKAEAAGIQLPARGQQSEDDRPAPAQRNPAPGPQDPDLDADGRPIAEDDPLNLFSPGTELAH